MFKKTSIDNKYRFVDTEIVDTSFNSYNYFNLINVPTTFTIGKNSIRFNIRENIFESDSNILFELIDYNGNPIYYEFSDYIEGDKSRLIVVYIYDDTPVGGCIGTFLGKTKGSEFYNVKYQFNSTIDTDSSNNCKLIFGDNVPKVEIKEKIKSKYDISYNQSQTVNSTIGTMTYSLINGTPYLTSNGFTFTSEMNGAEFRLIPQNIFPNINLNYQPQYTSSISKVLNSNYVKLDVPFSVNKEGITYTPKKFSNTPNNITYNEDGNRVETERFQSYAHLKFNGLESITGNVDKIGVFVKSLKGGFQEYDLINIFELEKNNLLVDIDNVELNTNIGNIKSQNHIQYYYVSSSNDVSLTYSVSKIMNSIETTYNSNVTIPYNFEINENYSVDVFSDCFYTLEFDYYGIQDSDFEGIPEIEVYVYGNSIKKTNEHGYLLDNIKINSNNNQNNKFQYTFKPINNGLLSVRFRVKGGKWFISNINLSSIIEDGYNPKQLNLLTPIPSDYRNEFLNFKFEYYNANGEKSKTITFKENVYFTGSNFYIEGDNNLVTGTLSIGQEIGSGIVFESNQQNNGISLGNLKIESKKIELTPSQLSNWGNTKYYFEQLKTGSFFIPQLMVLETGGQNITGSGVIGIYSDYYDETLSKLGTIAYDVIENDDLSTSSIIHSKDLTTSFSRGYGNAFSNDLYISASANMNPVTDSWYATMFYREIKLSYISNIYIW